MLFYRRVRFFDGSLVTIYTPRWRETMWSRFLSKKTTRTQCYLLVDKMECTPLESFVDFTLDLLFPLFQDKSNKVFLNWLTSQRKKKLGHLKNARFDRYLTLSKELDIPLLESPHTKWNKYKFRKFKIGVEVKEKKRFHRWLKCK